MRKSQSINTEAVLAKTREILEAEEYLKFVQASTGEHFEIITPNVPNRPAAWDEVGRYVDTGLLAQVKIDQLKHEYSVLLTGARPRKPKAKSTRKPRLDAGQIAKDIAASS